ncbi:FAD-dependent oxidoreductase [Carboxydocella sp. JDF658]|uniref:FAD-dependent oxidoreductase n=1 Tax=Carboxydocella sp. JDF658 TaxID=1926600 RepID=UPI0009AD5B2D|nr:FAD-dependent oxidoreductase [Carboxydocella sp. JDF658]GAW30485.1 4Fe-4S ferredoxin [Carboxydocella sp. JDF658]
MKPEQVIGAALVVGGGPAGMTAALDLAESGHLVHLVTIGPSLGGTMAQLDKTFPTNDCAMCLLGPKMTDTLNHPNIRLSTCTDLLELKGEPGQFTARLRVRPRYVKEEECTACGECEQVCPVELPAEFNQGLNRRKAVHKAFPQAVPNKYLISKRGTSPCRLACPAGINVHAYVALAAQGRWREAWDIIREAIPFPIICGTVCHHPCEQVCQRGQVEEPVAISRIKRFIGVKVLEELRDEDIRPAIRRQERVAVVGSGPAGLSCAYHLARRGYQVTVFEALPVAGGMMQVGIPEYRLPKALVQKEIELVQRLGVEIRVNSPIGGERTITSLLEKEGFQAVFLGIGAHEPQTLGLPGEELDGIYHGVSFLRQVALGERPVLGRKVAVIGGGNTAMDAARTALRLGAEEVTVIYRRTEEEMTALPEEVVEAREEGVEFRFLTSPLAFLGQERVQAIKIQKNQLGPPGPDGRRQPRGIPGSEEELAVDAVIIAVSQAPEKSFLGEHPGLKTRGRLIEVDPVTLATSLPGVFAGGDAVTGPKTLVEACAAGREAAESIDRYLNGLDLYQGRERRFLPEARWTPEELARVQRQRRVAASKLHPLERRQTFAEVVQQYSEELARQEAARCLNCGGCCECRLCESACKKQAIAHDQQAEEREIAIGAVLLAPGFSLFDARCYGELGYGIYPDVVTSLEFERILSSTGPSQGHVVRPSDGQTPRKIAFIQCVGSRDACRGNSWCSSICCMYSVKEAIIAREHDPEIEPTIFYLDLRAYGKNFDRYVQSAREQGVRFIRSMVAGVKYDPVRKKLLVQFSREGQAAEEEFDLVVLAVGVEPPAGAKELARAAGIELNQYGFAWTPPEDPVATSRSGVFVAGAFQGPRDIPETVASASAAAARIAALLAPGRHTLVQPKTYPPERDVSQEEARIGVFICRCGINIAAVINVPRVVEAAARLPGVVWAEEFLYSCSQDSLKQIINRIHEHQLNRIVVASCTIRTHQPLFREALKEAGLNQFLFEMANIRDQCSWVHRLEPEAATAKAIDLVKMAVAKVALHRPLQLHPVPVVNQALIIGGGPAGMAAAYNLAEMGFPVHLVEKKEELGGLAGYPGDESVIADLRQRVQSHARISIYTRSHLTEIGGHQGHFRSRIETPAGPVVVEHGAVVVATGLEEAEPDPDLTANLGEGWLSLRQVTQLLEKEPDWQPAFERISIVLCASQPLGPVSFCSRTCCLQGLRLARQLKSRWPRLQVHIHFREMRSYGFLEEEYRQARQEKIRFFRYEENWPRLNLRQEGVVLATGARPPADLGQLASLLKVHRNEQGLLVETHAKLGPLDFPSAGFYLAGAAHAPKLLAEAIAQGAGAAARAATILSRRHLLAGGVVAFMARPEQCAACLTCVRVCPYGVPHINADMVAEINPVQCHGCGTCVGECPGQALELAHYHQDYLAAKVRALAYTSKGGR